MRYAERRSRRSSWVAPRRSAAAFVGDRYGRNFIRQVDKSESPATMSYCGASRCQPMGEPARYSLISAMANASALTCAHAATSLRSESRNSGIGPAASRLYDSPKNATRRRATTPRISKSENGTEAIASSSSRSWGSLMKFSRYGKPEGTGCSKRLGTATIQCAMAALLAVLESKCHISVVRASQ